MEGSPLGPVQLSVRSNETNELDLESGVNSHGNLYGLKFDAIVDILLSPRAVDERLFSRLETDCQTSQ